MEKKTKTVEDDDDEMEGEEEAKATSHSEEQITNGDEDEGGEEEEEEGETENEDQPELPSGLTGMVLLSLQSVAVIPCDCFFASMCCPFTASLVKWVSAEADRNSCTASVFRRRYVSSSNSSTRT